MPRAGLSNAVLACVFILGMALFPTPLMAGDAARHGLSIFGDLKYPADFTHFDYVNPEAPKGGTLSHVGSTVALNASFLSFDTLNGFILKGDAAQGLSLIFDSLMARAWDEPDAVYGLVAKSAAVSANGNRVTFHLREGPRFHDGSALTAADVAFSLMLLKDKGHPLVSQNLRELARVETPDARTVIVQFTGRQTRDLPLFVAQLPIFSKAYYSTHAFDETTLEPPLGSGPYRIGEFRPGQFIAYQRVADYWAKDLPINAGKWNFDKIRFDYFRDRTAQFEAFKAGAYYLREEFTSKVWATEYNFPAIKDGRVTQLVLPDDTPSGAQGWFINTRRAKFQDVRVRQALVLAFDFEWTNRNQFYGLYKRTASFFENSAMKAAGPPSAEELALLAPYRDQLPSAAFGEAVLPPVSDGSGQDRLLLRQASELLEAAGWQIENGVRRNAQGDILSIEFLADEPTFERIIAPYIKNLKLLGIDTRLRIVDSAQYQERLKNYDFDIVTQRYSVSVTPGLEIRAFWGSAFAALPGSRNLPGIANPVVDALIDKVIDAPSRETQIIAARALDRVLRAGHYWVPQWYKASHHLAFWDIYARPPVKPLYERGILETWWVDPDKEKKLAGPP